jgi:hypothetical protein
MAAPAPPVASARAGTAVEEHVGGRRDGDDRALKSGVRQGRLAAGSAMTGQGVLRGCAEISACAGEATAGPCVRADQGAGRRRPPAHGAAVAGGRARVGWGGACVAAAGAGQRLPGPGELRSRTGEGIAQAEAAIPCVRAPSATADRCARTAGGEPETRIDRAAPVATTTTPASADHHDHQQRSATHARKPSPGSAGMPSAPLGGRPDMTRGSV